MTEHPDPTTMTDAAIEAELAALAQEDEQLRRMRRHFKADAHSAIDRSVAAAERRLNEKLAGYVYNLAHAAGEAVVPAGIADDWVLATQPAVADAWHRAVDEATAGPSAGDIFGPMDRPEWEAERARITVRSADLENEAARRRAQRKHVEAERELAELEVRR